MREYICKDISYKKPLAKIYGKLLKLNNKKTTQLNNKTKIITDTSLKKMYI